MSNLSMICEYSMWMPDFTDQSSRIFRIISDAFASAINKLQGRPFWTMISNHESVGECQQRQDWNHRKREAFSRNKPKKNIKSEWFDYVLNISKSNTHVIVTFRRLRIGAIAGWSGTVRFRFGRFLPLGKRLQLLAMETINETWKTNK